MQCARMQPRRRVITVKARLLSPSDPFPISPLLFLLFLYSSRFPPSLLFFFLSFFRPSHSHRATVSFLAARIVSRDSKEEKNRDRYARRHPIPRFHLSHLSSTRLYRDKSLRRIIARPVERSISISFYGKMAESIQSDAINRLGEHDFCLVRDNAYLRVVVVSHWPAPQWRNFRVFRNRSMRIVLPSIKNSGQFQGFDPTNSSITLHAVASSWNNWDCALRSIKLFDCSPR